MPLLRVSCALLLADRVTLAAADPRVAAASKGSEPEVPVPFDV